MLIVPHHTAPTSLFVDEMQSKYRVHSDGVTPLIAFNGVVETQRSSDHRRQTGRILKRQISRPQSAALIS